MQEFGTGESEPGGSLMVTGVKVTRPFLELNGTSQMEEKQIGHMYIQLLVLFDPFSFLEKTYIWCYLKSCLLYLDEEKLQTKQSRKNIL